MTIYTKKDLEELSGTDLMELVNEGDIITDLYIKDFMGFSSFTGLPYDTIGTDIKLAFGGVFTRYQEEGDGPFSVTIRRKSSSSLFLGLVENQGNKD